MSEREAVPAPSAHDPGLLARLLGVIVSPRRTYAAIVARPRVLGAMAVVVLLTAGTQWWLMSSEGGQRAMQAVLEEGFREAAAEGQEITAEQRAASAQLVRLMGTFMAVAQVVLGPAVLAVIAAVLMGVLNALLGATVAFRPAFAVVTYSSVVMAVGSLFAAPLMVMREEMASPTRLAVLFPMLPEEGFLTFLLTSLDLVIVWWLFNLAVGLAVLYRRSTGSLATSLLGMYAGVLVLVAAIGSF